VISSDQFTRPELTFDPPTHTYHWKGTKCISVTEFIALFKSPFDDKKMAAQKALERGNTQEAILEEWTSIRNEASDYGNKAHAIAAESVRNKHRGVALAEVPICLPNYLLAGTVDLLYVTPGGTKGILDWKTNKKMNVLGYTYMLPPLNTLFDCNWNNYCLQLSLYAHILRESYDFDATTLTLAHIPKGGPPKCTQILDYRKHVTKLLEWRRQHIDKRGDTNHDE